MVTPASQDWLRHSPTLWATKILVLGTCEADKEHLGALSLADPGQWDPQGHHHQSVTGNSLIRTGECSRCFTCLGLI